MDKINELYRAKGLLQQALGAALNSMPNNKSVQDARMHMKKALNELDNAAKTQLRKKSMTEDQFKTWWGNVMSGTTAIAQQPMTAEAQVKSLAQLDAMIAEEQKKINEIEKSQAAAQPPATPDLFND